MAIECLMSAIFYGVLFFQFHCRITEFGTQVSRLSCKKESSRSEVGWRVADSREVEKGTSLESMGSRITGHL
jgi:hypothetical protein